MSNQYQVPLHLCQWCYKNTGRYIVDCLCVVCQSCFKGKKDWLVENNKCFSCQKPTARKLIDLKTNPQEGSMYFQNLGISIKNIARVQQFQQQVTKKYTKHLEVKIKKLESVIMSFVSQFPEFRSFFENAFAQYEKKQVGLVRSKSSSSELNGQQVRQGQTLYQSNTERNLAPNQVKGPAINQMKNSNYTNNNNFSQNYGHDGKYSVSSKQSYSSAMSGNVSQMGNQRVNQPPNNYNLQNKMNFDPSSNSMPYREGDPRQFKLNQNQQFDRKISIHSNQSNCNVPGMYRIGGDKRRSDQSKQQVNNISSINMQTALRSIRSEDERQSTSPFGARNFDSRKKQPNQRSEANQYSSTANNTAQGNPGQFYLFNQLNQKKFPK